MTKFNNSRKEDYFVYLSMFMLLLITFPLAIGWVGLGGFIPRAIYIVFIIVIKPNLFMRKDNIFLSLYFVYIIITDTEGELAIILANYMEFLISLLLANYYLETRSKNQILIARYAIIISVFIMINTILVNLSSPGIVRSMVGFSSQGAEEESLYYIRMGVSGYAFAQISMCLAPVFLFMSKVTKYTNTKILYFSLFLLVTYFVFITGITTCLIILLFMLVLYFANIKIINISKLLIVIIITSLVLYFIGLTVIEFLLPHFEGTTFYSHMGGLLEFYGKNTFANDIYNVEDRVSSYQDSFGTFLSNPLFGSSTGKNGGHNYFLDRLARVGIIGVAPLLIFMFYRFKAAFDILSLRTKMLYFICILGFLLLGSLKNLAGIDYWTYMFFYIPCILKYGEMYRANRLSIHKDDENSIFISLHR